MNDTFPSEGGREESAPIKGGFAVLCVIPVAPVVASFAVGAHPEFSWKSALTNAVSTKKARTSTCFLVVEFVNPCFVDGSSSIPELVCCVDVPRLRGTVSFHHVCVAHSLLADEV